MKQEPIKILVNGEEYVPKFELKGNSIPQKSKFPENSLIKENGIPKKRIIPEVSVERLQRLNEGSGSSLREELKELFQELTTWWNKFWKLRNGEGSTKENIKYPREELKFPPPRPIKDNSEG